MKLYFVFTIALIFSLKLHAQTCEELNQCVTLVSTLTGEKYMSFDDLKGKVHLSDNFKITEKNADYFLSEALFENGYSRIKATTGEWKIIKSRDIRYNQTMTLLYGKDKIAKNYDYVTTSFQLKNKNAAREITRSFRPFLSRYGRILNIKSSGTIVINDTGVGVHRLANLIKLIDKEPTAKDLKNDSKAKLLRDKIKLLKAKNCSDIEGKLNEILGYVSTKAKKGK